MIFCGLDKEDSSEDGGSTVQVLDRQGLLLSNPYDPKKEATHSKY